MKIVSIILGACLAVLGVTGGSLFVTERRSTRDLQEANEKLKADLFVAEAKAEALIAERAEAADQLMLAQDASEGFKARIAEVEAAQTKEAESDAGVPAVAPYQAHAYLGQRPIGWVWIIPQNLRKDAKTQRYVYEPVVWLDESVRKQFVTHHTNVVEREVESRTYVNSYYPQPAYYVSPPHFPIPCPPTNFPPAPTPPPTVQPAPRPFNPGSGKVTAQRLGTPAGAIKTKPSP